MKHVSVTLLRQNLPHYLRLVQRGEHVSVTHRGRVIAELTPASAPADEVLAARARLRGSVVAFDRPLEPIFSADEWDMHR